MKVWVKIKQLLFGYKEHNPNNYHPRGGQDDKEQVKHLGGEGGLSLWAN
jgi:hypothetical protein